LYKIRRSPDFEGLTEEEAMQDLKARAAKYEERYETIDDDSLLYVKLFNFSSEISANNIYGRVAKVVVPALMAWHVAERPILLCRAGNTFANDLNIANYLWQSNGYLHNILTTNIHSLVKTSDYSNLHTEQVLASSRLWWSGGVPINAHSQVK
jgi:hypothetical protein